jgi:hypothetical protein
MPFVLRRVELSRSPILQARKGIRPLRHAQPVRWPSIIGGSGLIWSRRCQEGTPKLARIHRGSGQGVWMFPCGLPFGATGRGPESGSGLAVGHPEGLALTPARTSSPWGRVGERRLVTVGAGRERSACRSRRIVEADMRGLVTAGRCFRLERYRWSKDERGLIPDGDRLLIARGRIAPRAAGPGRCPPRSAQRGPTIQSSGRTASDQHQPASSRATATFAITGRFLRSA